MSQFIASTLEKASLYNHFAKSFIIVAPVAQTRGLKVKTELSLAAFSLVIDWHVTSLFKHRNRA